MSRIVRMKADPTRKLRWLAVTTESPAHLCVEQRGVAAPICGVRLKRKAKLYNHVSATQRRCKDCHGIDQAMKAARRAQRIAMIMRPFKAIARFFSDQKIAVTLHRDGRREISKEVC